MLLEVLKNLANLLMQHLKMPNWVLYLFLAVSFLGFADASYLTALHFLGEAPACSILEGCEQVTTSSYSVVFGIPVALLGALYYLTIFLSTAIFLDTPKKLFAQILKYLPWTGLIASAWFVYLQLFVIEAICLWCMGSAVSSSLLFIFSFFVSTRNIEK